MAKGLWVCPSGHGTVRNLPKLMSALELQFGRRNVTLATELGALKPLLLERRMVERCSVLLLVIERTRGGTVSTGADSDGAAWSSTSLEMLRLAQRCLRRIVPVLLDGATIADLASLPEDLHVPATQEASFVHTDARLQDDVKQLAAHLSIQFAADEESLQWGHLAFLALSILLVVLWYELVGLTAAQLPVLVWSGLTLMWVFAGFAVTYQLFLTSRLVHEKGWQLLVVSTLACIVAVGALVRVTMSISGRTLTTLTPLVPNLPLLYTVLVALACWHWAFFQYTHRGSRVIAVRMLKSARQYSGPVEALLIDALPSAFFLSYRRTDSGAICEQIYTYLAKRFRESNVFRDVNSIQAGADFTVVLSRAVAGCRVMLVVIGPTWLSLADTSGQRRIDAQDDYVRFEIQRALELHKPIIPVLVNGATLPRASALPGDIRALANLRPISVRNGVRFRRDMRQIVHRYRRAPQPYVEHKVLRWGAYASFVACLLTLSYCVYVYPASVMDYVGHQMTLCYVLKWSGIVSTYTFETACRVQSTGSLGMWLNMLLPVCALLLIATWTLTFATMVLTRRWRGAIPLLTTVALTTFTGAYLWMIFVSSPSGGSELVIAFVCWLILPVALVWSLICVIRYSQGVVAARWVGQSQ